MSTLLFSLYIVIDEQNPAGSLVTFEGESRLSLSNGAQPLFPPAEAAPTPAHGCLNSKQRALSQPVQVRDERIATVPELRTCFLASFLSLFSRRRSERGRGGEKRKFSAARYTFTDKLGMTLTVINDFFSSSDCSPVTYCLQRC